MIFRKFLKPIWSTGPSISLSFWIRRKKYFIYLRILWIFGISCMKDLNALRDDLMELKPTLFAGVPRVFEKVHEGKFTHQQKIYILFEFSIKLIKDHLFQVSKKQWKNSIQWGEEFLACSTNSKLIFYNYILVTIFFMKVDFVYMFVDFQFM